MSNIRDKTVRIFIAQDLDKRVELWYILATKKMQKRIPSYLVGGEEGADACIESQHK